MAGRFSVLMRTMRTSSANRPKNFRELRNLANMFFSCTGRKIFATVTTVVVSITPGGT